MTETPLKLFALDEDDLAVVSAHLQDAVVKSDEIVFQSRAKRLVVMAKRFDWEAHDLTGARQRRLTGLRVERVLDVKARGVPRGGSATLNLLALRFAAGASPAGMVELTFSGGAALRLTVECVEVAMEDLGPMWETEAAPDHPAA